MIIEVYVILPIELILPLSPTFFSSSCCPHAKHPPPPTSLNTQTHFVACSKAVEIVSYMSNQWNVPVITPIGNTENIGDKKVFPRLTRINPTMQSALVTTVFTLLDKYSWGNIGKDVREEGMGGGRGGYGDGAI